MGLMVVGWPCVSRFLMGAQIAAPVLSVPYLLPPLTVTVYTYHTLSSTLRCSITVMHVCIHQLGLTCERWSVGTLTGLRRSEGQAEPEGRGIQHMVHSPLTLGKRPTPSTWGECD
ncbi:hypothetical protein EDB83DRAFT_1781489 [Lactarius deliciosus]|nr:hypothetical protein EDB83DRAFT_462037 [Lactarius deliciosus]KAH9034386.1 hypothetical protein EDB83DRAFT_1781489 [Lactarius deliciosus]